MVTADKPLVELVKELPPEAQGAARDFVEYLLSKHGRAIHSAEEEAENLAASFPVDPRRQAMLDEVEAYHQLHPELLTRYPDQYVAIYHGQLIDHDKDPAALIERTEAKWPGQVILRRRVEPVPESVLAIRSPRLLPVS